MKCTADGELVTSTNSIGKLRSSPQRPRVLISEIVGYQGTDRWESMGECEPVQPAPHSGMGFMPADSGSTDHVP